MSAPQAYIYWGNSEQRWLLMPFDIATSQRRFNARFSWWNFRHRHLAIQFAARRGITITKENES